MTAAAPTRAMPFTPQPSKTASTRGSAWLIAVSFPTSYIRDVCLVVSSSTAVPGDGTAAVDYTEVLRTHCRWRGPVCQYSTFNAADLVCIRHCRSYNELELSASWSQSIRPYYHEKLVARDAYHGS